MQESQSAPKQAIQFFPGEVFGGAYARGQVFQISAYRNSRSLQKARKGF